MDLAWYIYPLALLGGVAAGVINTLAGSGSLITLPMLIFMGLPANVANATNRVGVLVQNVVGISTFRRRGGLPLENIGWYLIPTLPGAVLGAWLASSLGKQQMDIILAVIMVAMLFVVILDPQKWLRSTSDVKPGRPSLLMIALMFAVGVYGAFIQVSVGVFILAALVLGAGFNLTEANALKLVIILVVTAIAMVIFLTQPGLINWWLGALMAVGQSIGAWLAARFATSRKNANVWIRRLLIVVVVASILDLLGIFDRLPALFA